MHYFASSKVALMDGDTLTGEIDLEVGYYIRILNNLEGTFLYF